MTAQSLESAAYRYVFYPAATLIHTIATTRVHIPTQLIVTRVLCFSTIYISSIDDGAHA